MNNNKKLPTSYEGIEPPNGDSQTKKSLHELKISLLYPHEITFDQNEPLSLPYLQRLRGNGSLIFHPNFQTKYSIQIDFSDEKIYAKDVITIQQGMGIKDFNLLMVERMKNEDRDFLRGIEHVKKIGNAKFELGLLSDFGDKITMRSRMRTNFGKEKRGSAVSLIEYEIIGGTYSGRSRLSYNVLNNTATFLADIEPFVTIKYKGDIRGKIEVSPFVGIIFPIK